MSAAFSKSPKSIIVEAITSDDIDACSDLPGRKGSRCEAGAAPQL